MKPHMMLDLKYNILNICSYVWEKEGKIKVYLQIKTQECWLD